MAFDEIMGELMNKISFANAPQGQTNPLAMALMGGGAAMAGAGPRPVPYGIGELLGMATNAGLKNYLLANQENAQNERLKAGSELIKQQLEMAKMKMKDDLEKKKRIRDVLGNKLVVKKPGTTTDFETGQTPDEEEEHSIMDLIAGGMSKKPQVQQAIKLLGEADPEAFHSHAVDMIKELVKLEKEGTTKPLTLDQLKAGLVTGGIDPSGINPAFQRMLGMHAEDKVVADKKSPTGYSYVNTSTGAVIPGAPDPTTRTNVNINPNAADPDKSTGNIVLVGPDGKPYFTKSLKDANEKAATGYYKYLNPGEQMTQEILDKVKGAAKPKAPTGAPGSPGNPARGTITKPGAAAPAGQIPKGMQFEQENGKVKLRQDKEGRVWAKGQDGNVYDVTDYVRRK